MPQTITSFSPILFERVRDFSFYFTSFSSSLLFLFYNFFFSLLRRFFSFFSITPDNLPLMLISRVLFLISTFLCLFRNILYYFHISFYIPIVRITVA